MENKEREAKFLELKRAMEHLFITKERIRIFEEELQRSKDEVERMMRELEIWENSCDYGKCSIMDFDRGTLNQELTAKALEDARYMDVSLDDCKKLVSVHFLMARKYDDVNIPLEDVLLYE